MQRTLLMLLFLGLFTTTTFQDREAIASGNRTNPCRWEAQLRKRGFALPKTYRNRLIRASIRTTKPKLSTRHRRLNRSYRRILKSVRSVQRCYQRKYQRSRSYKARRTLLKRLERQMVRVLDNVTLPLWIGTPWDFYGTATAPHQKSIACGYFVVHALLSVGFRFPQNFLYRSKKRGPMRIYKFAKQAAGTMARIVSRPSQRFVTSRKPITSFKKPLKKMGPGVYILGLDDHVGLVLYNGKTAVFWHSNYAEPQAWVKRENLYDSPVAKASNYRLLAKIHHSWLRKWMYRTPIRVP